MCLSLYFNEWVAVQLLHKVAALLAKLVCVHYVNETYYYEDIDLYPGCSPGYNYTGMSRLPFALCTFSKCVDVPLLLSHYAAKTWESSLMQSTSSSWPGGRNGLCFTPSSSSCICSGWILQLQQLTHAVLLMQPPGHSVGTQMDLSPSDGAVVGVECCSDGTDCDAVTGAHGSRSPSGSSGAVAYTSLAKVVC